MRSNLSVSMRGGGVMMIAAMVVLLVALASPLLGVEASCSAGSSGSPCVACPKGYYCTGGSAPAVACPNGFKCPAGASAPVARTLKGVNLAGGEFTEFAIPGILNQNYIYPSNAALDYWAGIGFRVIRLPFSIGRMQPVLNAALSTNEVSLVMAVVTYAASKGLSVILDPHDYGQMYIGNGALGVLGVPGGLPASDFGDFWGRMAQAFKNQPTAIFGLMNEPNIQTAVQWHDVAVVAVAAIRAAGATNKILIPGTSWTGAHSWISSGNAAAWVGFTDTNFAFELHQYLDYDASGSHAECVAGQGASPLVDATNWARTNGYELFLGEFGWAVNTQCTTEATTFTAYMTTNADVWLGWTYWAAGAWWGTYMFTLEPTSFSTPYVYQPQASILLANLVAPWVCGAACSTTGSGTTTTVSSSSSSTAVATAKISSSSTAGVVKVSSSSTAGVVQVISSTAGAKASSTAAAAVVGSKSSSSGAAATSVPVSTDSSSGSSDTGAAAGGGGGAIGTGLQAGAHSLSSSLWMMLLSLVAVAALLGC